jgi:hypothetical protein
MKMNIFGNTIRNWSLIISILFLNIQCQGNSEKSQLKDNTKPSVESDQAVSKSTVKIEIKHGISMPDGDPAFTLLISGMKVKSEIAITAIDTTGAKIVLIPESNPVFADQNGEMIIDVHYGVKGMKPGTCLFIVILDKAEVHQFTTEMPTVIPPTEAKKKWTLKFKD